MNGISRNNRCIAILGDGIEGSLAAAWIASRYHGCAVQVVQVQVAGSDRWDRAYTVLPARPDDLVRALGISDLTLVQKAGASFALGLRLEQGLLPFGPTGISMAGAAFHHHWQIGDPTSGYFEYSPAWVAAQTQRFAPPVPRNAIGPLQHEYARLVDTTTLTRLLRDIACAAGVVSTSQLTSVQETADSTKLEISLADDQTVLADFVIDARGAAAYPTASSDRDWLQCHIGDEAATESSYAVQRDDQTWRLSLPLAEKCITLQVEQQAAPPLDASPRSERQIPIGFAAGILAPALPWHASLLMRHIRRIANLLPTSAESHRNIHTMRRQFEADTRSFSDALTIAAAPTSEDPTKDAGHSDTLRHRLALWQKRGIWNLDDGSLIDPLEWHNLLMLILGTPRHHDPLAARLSAAQRRQNLDQLREAVARVTAEFPTLTEYLAAARAQSLAAHS